MSAAMKAEQISPDRFVDVKELAAFLTVPRSWVYSKTASGQIPHTKVGRYIRFWLPDVMDWLKSGSGDVL